MGEGVDHRQVQRELGDMSVYLQKPVILSPTSARLSWTVSATVWIFKRRLIRENAKADPFLLFPDGPSVPLRSGLPRLLPHHWQLLASPGRGSSL